VRHFEVSHIRAILTAVQPIRVRVVLNQPEITYFKNLIHEIQTDIGKAHEAVARAWLNSESGQQWLENVANNRKQNKAIPHVTYEQISQDLMFSVKEIKALWTSISSVAHPAHWDEYSWYDGDIDGHIFETMESTSYKIIAKMANGLNVGVKAHRTLSVQARLRILAGVSSLQTPDRWPELPIDGSALPDTPEGWKGYPDIYPTCTANDDFARIFGRFGDPGIAFFTKLANRPYPSDISSRASTPEPASQPPTSQPQPAEADAPEDKGVDDSSQIKAEPGQSDEANTHGPVNAVDPGEYILDTDGNPVLLVSYDDEDEPTQSSWMFTGDETVKIDDEGMKHLARLAKLDSEEDYKAIEEWKAYHNPDITFITARAFDLARIGGFGLARYALDDLMSDAAVYGNLAEHFADRRVARLAEAANLAEVLSDVQQKLAALEAEADRYRAVSGNATVLQQNVNQHKRIMARVQNQLGGARAHAMQNPRLGRGAMPPPSSIRRQTASPAPPIQPSASGSGAPPATPATPAPPALSPQLSGRQSSGPPGRSPADTLGTQSRKAESEFQESDWTE
jgi:hypothetical protein